MNKNNTKHFIYSICLLALLIIGCKTTAPKKAMYGGVNFNSLNVQDSEVVKTFETAKANDKNVLLIFDAVWCGYCRKLNTITMKDAEVRKTLSDFEIVNVDVDKYPKVLKEFTRGKGRKGVPLIMIFSPEGLQTDEIGGYLPAKPFNKVLKKNL